MPHVCLSGAWEMGNPVVRRGVSGVTLGENIILSDFENLLQSGDSAQPGKNILIL